jgi:hypothetical protein
MGKIQPFKAIKNIVTSVVPGARLIDGLLGGGGGGNDKAVNEANAARQAAEANLATQKANEDSRFKAEQLRLQEASNEEIGKRSTALSAFLARQKNDPNFGGNKFASRGKRVSIFDDI